MTITYDNARDLVRTTLGRDWTNGTFCLDDRTITETPTHWVFNVGAREFLVDDNPAFAEIGGVTAVRKDDGTIETLSSLTVATDPTTATRPNPSPTFE
ncbi:hypothetical protein [Streptacidiphilus sp. EB103A]|uniref:hypothetical protein n=1 Tax=Streptacidiphilus sp. EB103A TaxID=3156275 RepID=UPI0035162D6D